MKPIAKPKRFKTHNRPTIEGNPNTIDFLLNMPISFDFGQQHIPGEIRLLWDSQFGITGPNEPLHLVAGIDMGDLTDLDTLGAP